MKYDYLKPYYFYNQNNEGKWIIYYFIWVITFNEQSPIKNSATLERVFSIRDSLSEAQEDAWSKLSTVLTENKFRGVAPLLDPPEKLTDGVKKGWE